MAFLRQISFWTEPHLLPCASVLGGESTCQGEPNLLPPLGMGWNSWLMVQKSWRKPPVCAVCIWKPYEKWNISQMSTGDISPDFWLPSTVAEDSCTNRGKIPFSDATPALQNLPNEEYLPHSPPTSMASKWANKATTKMQRWRFFIQRNLLSSLSTHMKKSSNKSRFHDFVHWRSHQTKMGCSVSGVQIHLFSWDLWVLSWFKHPPSSTVFPQIFIANNDPVHCTLQACTRCKLLSSFGFGLLICQGFLHQHLCCCPLMQAGVLWAKKCIFRTKWTLWPHWFRDIPWFQWRSSLSWTWHVCQKTVCPGKTRPSLTAAFCWGGIPPPPALQHNLH